MQRFLIGEFIGDLIAGVVMKRMMEESVGGNRFAGPLQTQSLPRNFPRGVIGAKNRESELRGSDEDNESLQRCSFERAPAVGPETECENSRSQNGRRQQQADSPAPSVFFAEIQGCRYGHCGGEYQVNPHSCANPCRFGGFLNQAGYADAQNQGESGE